MNNIYYTYDLEYDEERLVSLESVFADIDMFAMEAENDADKVDDTPTKQENVNTNSFLERVKTMFATLLRMVMEMFDKIALNFKRVMLTNKGFLNDLKLWKSRYKPEPFVEVINFEYGEQRLQYLNNVSKVARGFSETIYNTYKSGAKSLDKIEDQNNILNFEEKEFVSAWIQKLGGNTDNIGEFLRFVKEKFRGDKKTVKIPASALAGYEQFLRSYPTLVSEANDQMSKIRSEINSAKTFISSILSNAEVSQDLRTKLMKQTRNLSKTIALNVQLIHYIVDLKIEYAVNSRIVIRKFYRR